MYCLDACAVLWDNAGPDARAASAAVEERVAGFSDVVSLLLRVPVVVAAAGCASLARRLTSPLLSPASALSRGERHNIDHRLTHRFRREYLPHEPRSSQYWKMMNNVPAESVVKANG